MSDIDRLQIIIDVESALVSSGTGMNIPAYDEIS